MSSDKLSADEAGFLRQVQQAGSVKVGRGADAALAELAAKLEARGFVRAVKTERPEEDGAYMVLTGRGVIRMETAA